MEQAILISGSRVRAPHWAWRLFLKNQNWNYHILWQSYFWVCICRNQNHDLEVTSVHVPAPLFTVAKIQSDLDLCPWGTRPRSHHGRWGVGGGLLLSCVEKGNPAACDHMRKPSRHFAVRRQRKMNRGGSHMRNLKKPNVKKN